MTKSLYGVLSLAIVTAGAVGTILGSMALGGEVDSTQVLLAAIAIAGNLLPSPLAKDK